MKIAATPKPPLILATKDDLRRWRPTIRDQARVLAAVLRLEAWCDAQAATPLHPAQVEASNAAPSPRFVLSPTGARVPVFYRLQQLSEYAPGRLRGQAFLGIFESVSSAVSNQNPS